MKKRTLIQLCLFLALALIVARPAIAVIAAKVEVFESSAAVVQLKITGLTAANKVVDADVVKVVLGKFPAAPLKVQLARPAGVFEKVHAGSDMLLFVSQRGGGQDALLHVADMWLDARLSPRKTGWIAIGEHPEMYKSFPGTTAALARLASNRRPGTGASRPANADAEDTTQILEQIHDNLIFTAKPVVLGAAPAGTSALYSIDIAPGRAILLAQTPDGIKALDPAEKLQDITAKLGLADVKGPLQAAGDFDGSGKPGLAIDGQKYIFDGRTFKPAGAAKLPTGSAVVGPFLDDGQMATVTAGAHDITATAGDAAYDFYRLTGQKTSTYDKDNQGLPHASIRSLEVNGDGRPDLLVISDNLGFLLINRGYGCFFAAEISVRNLRESAGFAIGGQTPWTPAHISSSKYDDVVLLTPQKTLIAISPAKP